MYVSIQFCDSWFLLPVKYCRKINVNLIISLIIAQQFYILSGLVVRKHKNCNLSSILFENYIEKCQKSKKYPHHTTCTANWLYNNSRILSRYSSFGSSREIMTKFVSSFMEISLLYQICNTKTNRTKEQQNSKMLLNHILKEHK